MKVNLTAEQIALLLQILDEKLTLGEIEASDKALAFGTLAILEEAENAVYRDSANANVFSNLHIFS